MVSIIIPCYNVENEINECIVSLINQTYSDIEIIAADDGSSDSTGIKLDELAVKDARVKVFHIKNQGRSVARNIGLDNSNGEFIIFVDSDDTVKENFVEKLYTTIIDNDADIVASSQYYNDIQTGDMVNVPAVNSITIYDSYFQYVEDVYLDKNKTFFVNCILATTKIYRRSIFENVKFPLGRICEDCWAFPEILFQCKKIVVLPDCLYFYRQRENMTTKSHSSRTIDQKIEAWLHNKDWWKEHAGEKHDCLIADCEKYICHFMYKNKQYVSKEKRPYFKSEYKDMVTHMLQSDHILLKTKIKYLTYAMPFIVWR